MLATMPRCVKGGLGLSCCGQRLWGVVAADWRAVAETLRAARRQIVRAAVHAAAERRAQACPLPCSEDAAQRLVAIVLNRCQWRRPAVFRLRAGGNS